MDEIIAGLGPALKPGKSLTFVLGNNRVRGTEIPVADIVADLFARNGYESITLKERRILSDRRRYPYGITGFRGLMDCEFVLEGTAAGKSHDPPG